MQSGNRQSAAESQMRTEPEAPVRGPLRICHIASGDLWAGAEVQIATLMRFLAKDQRLALSAIILNPGRLADEIAGCGIPIQVIPESQMGLTSIIQRASDFISTQKAEIIHSHRYKENLVAARAAKRCGVSHIVRTQHGMPEPQQGIRKIKQVMINLLDRSIARKATDRVISVSQEMSHHLANLFETSKIVTIPNGIDATAVESNLTAGEAKSRLGIQPNCLVVGTAGRLEPVKRLDLFLRTATVILFDQRAAVGKTVAPISGVEPSHDQKRSSADAVPELRFVIAGDGREADSLASFARRLNISDRVHFLGHRDDIHDVLRAFDVLLITSDHEGMPMILLEAMALGIPIVTRAVGGIPEAIESGVNGLLVTGDDPRQLANACVSILAVPSVAERIADGGRQAVRGKFSAATNAACVAELYLSLCGRL